MLWTINLCFKFTNNKPLHNSNNRESVLTLIKLSPTKLSHIFWVKINRIRGYFFTIERPIRIQVKHVPLFKWIAIIALESRYISNEWGIFVSSQCWISILVFIYNFTVLLFSSSIMILRRIMFSYGPAFQQIFGGECLLIY